MISESNMTPSCEGRMRLLCMLQRIRQPLFQVGGAYAAPYLHSHSKLVAQPTVRQVEWDQLRHTANSIQANRQYPTTVSSLEQQIPTCDEPFPPEVLNPPRTRYLPRVFVCSTLEALLAIT